MKQTKRKYFPSSFLIIIGLMVFFIVASWIGQTVSSEIKGIGILDVFTSIWGGFVGKVEVIIFLLSIGGTLAIMTKIKAIDAGIGVLVTKMGDKVWILIPILMIIFGFGGTTFGMWEETIAFIPVLVPVFKKANYGPFTAILVIILGAGTGVLASTINPFAVGISVDQANKVIKEIDGTMSTITPGFLQGTRWISFLFLEMLAITMVVWMATKYKKGIINNITTEAQAKKMAHKNRFIAFFTRARVVEGIDIQLIEQRFKESDKIEFTIKRKISVILFISAFLIMIIMYLPWGSFFLENDLKNFDYNYNKNMWWFASTKKYSDSGNIIGGWSGFAIIGGWYFTSIAAIFLLFAIIIFAINFKEFKSNDENIEQGFISTYMKGVNDIIGVCLLIAVAGGLGIVLKSTGFGKVIAEGAAKGLKSYISFGVVVFIISIVLSLLIPSTTGFATAFMPIFSRIAIHAFPNSAPTAIGIAILGFIFANGLANFITPTSATLMGYTAYAGIPYNVWVKQTWKLLLMLFCLSLALIIGFSALAANGNVLF